MSYPIPENEDARLEVLHDLNVLYTPKDPTFDSLCQEAAERLRVPIALISLVDRHQQWFRASCGLGASGTARDVAFCAHAIMSDDVLHVPDARLDERFMHNPLVTGEPHIVFYAGAPIVYGRGIRLGTLCIIDSKPHPFSAEDEEVLIEIADRVAGELWALAFRQVGAA